MSDLPIADVQAPVAEAPAQAPKPKQYLLMADETTMLFLGKIMPSLLFVQVEGMAMQNNNEHMLLVNPLPKPASPETVPVPNAQPIEAV